MRRLLGAAVAALFSATALAHQLSVFAFVEEAEVVVEAKFSNGKRPVSGQVRVLDGDNALLTTLELGADGVARFPLSSVDHDGGLVIEVETGGGHDAYWILTPADIVRQGGG